MVARQSPKLLVKVQVLAGSPYEGDGIGIHTCLRSKVLRVQVPPFVPNSN